MSSVGGLARTRAVTVRAALLLTLASLNVGCPTAHPVPVVVSLGAPSPRASLTLARSEICWPSSRDEDPDKAVVADLDAAGSLDIDTQWTVRRLRDDTIMATIVGTTSASPAGQRAHGALSLDAHPLMPDDYVVVVSLRQGQTQLALRAPFSVVRCVYY